MSTTFYITSAKVDATAIDLYLDFGEFEREFVKEWPTTAFFESDGMLSWQVQEGHELGFEGLIHSDHQVISFKNHSNHFILWYRRFVPAVYSLFLSNESSADQLEITSNTTEMDVDIFFDS